VDPATDPRISKSDGSAGDGSAGDRSAGDTSTLNQIKDPRIFLISQFLDFAFFANFENFFIAADTLESSDSELYPAAVAEELFDFNALRPPANFL
jgi:hypothetical protein